MCPHPAQDPQWAFRKVFQTQCNNHPSSRFINRRSNTGAGFTLLELIIVMLLLTILLGFAVPAFQGNGFTNSGDKVVRELLYAVKKLKTAALSRQIMHQLHLDLDADRIWVTREQELPDSATPARTSEWTLPDNIHIAHVRFPDHREIKSGTVVMAFYPQGYSDRAIVRLTDSEGLSTDLIVEAFLPMAKIAMNDEETAF